MTGFGQAKAESSGIIYEVEARSVNHRFLDISIKLPKNLSALEYELRPLVSRYAGRGKIDLSLTRRTGTSGVQAISFDAAAFGAYVEMCRRAIESQGCSFDAMKENVVIEGLKRGEIVASAEEIVDLDSERAVIIPLFEEALRNLARMREAEGCAMSGDIRKRLEILRQIHAKVKKASAGLPEKFRERIYGRVKRLEPEVSVDESRLAAEIVLYCDRADVTEELVRLESHFAQFEKTLAEEALGRKLDFISQEFLREFNTVASKAQDAVIQALVVEGKTEIEKLKEQLQNVE